LVNSAKGRVKHSNVLKDPRVAISIIDKNNPYNMVSVTGKVIEQVSEGADSRIDELWGNNLHAILLYSNIMTKFETIL
jgi:hypothetical protein